MSSANSASAMEPCGNATLLSLSTAGSRQKLSEHTRTRHDGLPHPEVLPVQRSETPRRGSGILQPVQQCERLAGQSGVRLRVDADTSI